MQIKHMELRELPQKSLGSLCLVQHDYRTLNMSSVKKEVLKWSRIKEKTVSAPQTVRLFHGRRLAALAPVLVLEDAWCACSFWVPWILRSGRVVGYYQFFQIWKNFNRKKKSVRTCTQPQINIRLMQVRLLRKYNEVMSGWRRGGEISENLAPRGEP